MPKKIDFKERFFSKIIKNDDGCWGWKGAVDKDGYGRFEYKRGTSEEEQRAPRVAWIIYKGEIPNGMLVCHTCDNPICTNPEHLFLGTVKDNTKDMFDKGRANDRSGEKNGMAKLTREDVIKIRKFVKEGMMQKDVAKKFKVSRTEICNIIKGNREWKWLK